MNACNQLWPAFEKIQARLEQWQRQYPSLVRLTILGQTAGHRPLIAVQLTDSSVPDDGKEHALFTALHAGFERSGTTTLLYLMERLLSGEPWATETLRRQVLVCLPVANPDRYVATATVENAHVWGNTHRLDPYKDWTLDGPKDPEQHPEAEALRKLMDQYQPELHVDCHGESLAVAGLSALENSGTSYSNLSLRPYHDDICRLMDEAALAEGFASDRGENDAERVPWGPGLDPISEKLWMGRPAPFAALYAYSHYHTMTLASEICWELSGYVRYKRLLEVGNQTWPGEYYPGYPVRVIMWSAPHLLTAYGRTAAERRCSRVELWNRQAQILHGMIDPQIEGRIVYFCATSAAARAFMQANRALRLFVKGLDTLSHVQADPIRRVFRDYPNGPGQWGSEAGFYFNGGSRTSQMPIPDVPIEHGLVVRLRIPFGRAKDIRILLNGHSLSNSETEGYLIWVDRGYTFVQVNIPPARTKAQDLFIITCEYDPAERRSQGLAW